MKRKTFKSAPCQIARSLDILGDWWNPLILRECLYGVSKFDEFQQWLGIGRNILTNRLKLLVDEGILEKRPYQATPVRYEYRLTDKGYDASKVLLALFDYGEKWHFKPHREPIRLYQEGNGNRVDPLLVDANTGLPIDMRSLVPGPGPGFPRNKKIRQERFGDDFPEPE